MTTATQINKPYPIEHLISRLIMGLRALGMEPVVCQHADTIPRHVTFIENALKRTPNPILLTIDPEFSELDDSDTRAKFFPWLKGQNHKGIAVSFGGFTIAETIDGDEDTPRWVYQISKLVTYRNYPNAPDDAEDVPFFSSSSSLQAAKKALLAFAGDKIDAIWENDGYADERSAQGEWYFVPAVILKDHQPLKLAIRAWGEEDAVSVARMYLMSRGHIAEIEHAMPMVASMLTANGLSNEPQEFSTGPGIKEIP